MSSFDPYVFNVPFPFGNGNVVPSWKYIEVQHQSLTISLGGLSGESNIHVDCVYSVYEVMKLYTNDWMTKGQFDHWRGHQRHLNDYSHHLDVTNCLRTIAEVSVRLSCAWILVPSLWPAIWSKKKEAKTEVVLLQMA